MPRDLRFCKRVKHRYQTVTIGVAGALARERACEKVVGSRFTPESMTESKIYFSQKFFVASACVARPVSSCKWRSRISWYQMVCLPWISRVSTFTTNVANNCGVTDCLSGLSIGRRVKNLFLGIALGYCLIASGLDSAVLLASVVASAESAANYARSQKSHV